MHIGDAIHAFLSPLQETLPRAPAEGCFRPREGHVRDAACAKKNASLGSPFDIGPCTSTVNRKHTVHLDVGHRVHSGQGVLYK